MFLIHSEGQQTEMSQFGAEKDLLQDQARRTGSLCSKDPKSGFQGRVFKDSVRGKVHRMREQLVDTLLIGRW